MPNKLFQVQMDETNKEIHSFFRAFTYLFLTFILCLGIVFLQDVGDWGLGIILIFVFLILLHLIGVIIYAVVYFYFKRKKITSLLILMSIHVLISIYLRFFQLEIFI